jgi:hypothetical protein
MENLIQSLLQNLNMNDMLDGCRNYLLTSNLSEEEYMQIIEICTDKIDEIQLNKCVQSVKYNIEQFKSTLPENHPLLEYINNITDIKAYVNDENEIDDPKPSIEYVIETNYQNKNIVYFYEIVYDNINRTNYNVKSISIHDLDDEKDEMAEDEEEKEDEEDQEKETDSEEDMDVSINYDDEKCVESLSTSMNWNEPEALKLLLNAMYQTFDTDVPINWQ